MSAPGERLARSQRASVEAFNRGDFEQAFAYLAPHAEWHLLPWLPSSGTLAGRDAIIRYFADTLDAVDYRVQPLETTPVADRCFLIRMRGLATGRTLQVSDSFEFFQLLDVGADGLVLRVREFQTREEALAAIA